MLTAKENLHHENDDPLWYLIAEYSLSDRILNEYMGAELTVGSLIQAIQVLCLSPETLNKIGGIIAWVARKVISDKNVGCSNLPASIHLFCERNIMNRTSHGEDPVNGGWGFYVIERGRDGPNPSSQERQRVVELYLYREGK